MKVRISIIYSWFVRLITFWLPNHPIFMRFRGMLYSFMMRSCGSNFQITSSAILNSLSGLTIGKNVYIAHNCVIIGTDIAIEDEVIIGPNSVISSGNHGFDGNSFRYAKGFTKGVLIRQGSWISANCTVVGGAELPRRSVLAAGAVLNKPMLEEKSIYGGVPAKKIGDVK